MGELAFPTKKQVKGPWLLSKDDLLELDSVLKNVDNLLLKAFESAIEKHVNKTEPTAEEKDLIAASLS